jgi:hypothetical protein
MVVLAFVTVVAVVTAAVRVGVVVQSLGRCTM